MSESQNAFELTLTQRTELSARVESASNIASASKETAVNLLGDESAYTITSMRATIVRSILEHELADIERITTQPDDYPFEGYTPEDGLPPANEPIVGVAARLPVGTLSIKGSRRANDQQSSVVSTPAEAQAAREAFQNE